jgi:hypothetical protein
LSGMVRLDLLREIVVCGLPFPGFKSSWESSGIRVIMSILESQSWCLFLLVLVGLRLPAMRPANLNITAFAIPSVDFSRIRQYWALDLAGAVQQCHQTIIGNSSAMVTGFSPSVVRSANLNYVIQYVVNIRVYGFPTF